MYNVQDAVSMWAWVYFVSIIVLGSMLMMNLVLAVVMSKFREVRFRPRHVGVKPALRLDSVAM
jgi:hypothetical protein